MSKFVFWGRTTPEDLEFLEAPPHMRQHGVAVHEEFYFVEEDDTWGDSDIPLYWLAL